MYISAGMCNVRVVVFFCYINIALHIKLLGVHTIRDIFRHNEHLVQNIKFCIENGI